MSGPKGHQVSFGVYLDGELIFTVNRATTYKRGIFSPLKACEKHKSRVDKRSQCVHCKGLFQAKTVPNVDALLGVTAPADTEEGKQQREALDQMPAEMKKVARYRALATHTHLREAVQQVPEKTVCAACEGDIDCNQHYYCESCEVFVPDPLLGYSREGGKGDVVLTQRQFARLSAEKMERSIHIIGTLPPGYRFEEWQTGESWSLVPHKNDTTIHAMRSALHIARTGLLVYYCSADATGYSLKHEWVAVIRSAMDGKSLLLTQVRPEEDTAHRSHPLMEYGQGPVHAFMGLIMARQLDPDYMKGFQNNSRARQFLAGILDGSSTDTPRADPIRKKTDVSEFLKQVRESQQVPQPVEE